MSLEDTPGTRSNHLPETPCYLISLPSLHRWQLLALLISSPTSDFYCPLDFIGEARSSSCPRASSSKSFPGLLRGIHRSHLSPSPPPGLGLLLLNVNFELAQSKAVSWEMASPTLCSFRGTVLEAGTPRPWGEGAGVRVGRNPFFLSCTPCGEAPCRRRSWSPHFFAV